MTPPVWPSRERCARLVGRRIRSIRTTTSRSPQFRESTMFHRLRRWYHNLPLRKTSGTSKRRRLVFRPKCLLLERRDVPSVVADFNHDGFADLAVGVPGENNSAGAVNVIYGGSSGLAAGITTVAPNGS